ncbi:hypothetical protein [Streptomyces sp. NBC_01358]|nr:hypothetical protein [Streptomyces sp. NBC_01358]
MRAISAATRDDGVITVRLVAVSTARADGAVSPAEATSVKAAATAVAVT